MTPIEIYQLGKISLIAVAIVFIIFLVGFYIYKKRLNVELEQSYGKAEQFNGY